MPKINYNKCWLQTSFSFQRLSGSHKALVEMQDDVSELLRSATREYQQTKVRLVAPLYRLAVTVCGDLIDLQSSELHLPT